jgi:hypothetical protein
MASVAPIILAKFKIWFFRESSRVKTPLDFERLRAVAYEMNLAPESIRTGERIAAARLGLAQVRVSLTTTPLRVIRLAALTVKLLRTGGHVIMATSKIIMTEWTPKS